MSTPFVGVFSIGQTIDRGIKLYKLSLGKLFLLLLIPNLLMMTPMLMGSSMSTIMASGSSAKSLGMLGSFGILYVISMFFAAWAFIISVRYLFSLTTDQPISSLTELLRLARGKDVLYIITGIIWILTLGVSFILLIIPGLFLLNLTYLLAGPVTIIERHYFISGIGRMLQLGKRRWWKTFVINIVTVLIMIVPILLSYGFFMWTVLKGNPVFSGTAATSAITEGGFSLLGLAAMFIYAAVCALVYPLYISVGIVHYNSLRCEKESVDIASQLDSIPLASKK